MSSGRVVPTWRAPLHFARRLVLLAVAALLLAGPALTSSRPAAAQQAEDFAVPGGWFYTQARGGQPAGYGFAVLDQAGVPFWTAYQELGGYQRLGYPISHRFIWDRFPAQAFEAGVLHYRADVGVVQIVNVFDWLGQNGFDDWLFATYGAAPSLDWRDDVNFNWEFVVARHFVLLDSSPAIRKEYLSSGADPITYFGLPMSVADNGAMLVVRAQRALFQEWRQDSPWAKRGTVTIVTDGDALLAAGIIPANAAAPLLPPAAIALAGFPPVATFAPPARGLSPRAPPPPPDAPCPPYAPVQPYRPNCSTPYRVPVPGGVPAPIIAPAPGAYPAGPGSFGPAPIAPPLLAPYPGFAPFGGGACLGDESIQFVPNPAPANVEFSVEVSSNRYTLGVGLAGPGSIRLREVVAGGKGTVWKFAVIVGRGTFNYVFTRDGGAFACTQGTISVN